MVGCKKSAAPRIVNVGLQRHHAILAAFGQQHIQQGEELHVECLVVFFRVDDQFWQGLQRGEYGMAVIGGDKCAHRSATNDQQFDRLKKNAEMPASQRIPAKY